MKITKANAYTTPGSIAPLVTPDECAKLFTLPALAFKLFVCLVHVVDFKTGHGQTGYPNLIAMLTPAQPERGRPVAAPTRDEVKHMLRRFCDMGLIARDKGGSEDAKRIIFQMQPRSWESVSGELAARHTARRANAQNPDGYGAKPKTARTSRPTSRPRIHETGSFNSLPSNVDNLSTGQRRANRPTEGEKLAPPRGQNIAPAGHTPPPEALTGSRAGHEVGSHQGPPGGRVDAPAGHAPDRPELSAEERALLAQRDAEQITLARQQWAAERAHEPPTVRVDDPDTWQRDAEGRAILPIDHPCNQARKRTGYGPRRLSGLDDTK